MDKGCISNSGYSIKNACGLQSIFFKYPKYCQIKGRLDCFVKSLDRSNGMTNFSLINMEIF